MSDFLSWFTATGGTLDATAIGISDFPDTGRGAVALRDVEEGEKLFAIPRSLLLSTRTSALPGLIGEEEWTVLGDGWAGLILCMMWEVARGGDSVWAGYLGSMPTRFSTLMFWSEEELGYLRGSAVLDKIGRQEAERDYAEKMVPLLQKRPDLFPRAQLESHYSLENYHIQGSRILSRSFTVSPWTGQSLANGSGEVAGGDEEDDDEAPELLEAGGDGDVLMGEVNVLGDDSEEAIVLEDSDDDEERERVEDVVMVPMADMLNARCGCNNAKLFYTKDDLQMVTTKRIPRGEQIWNTYGDPPNSDLLRRYGYVDALPLADGIGSPSDVVEINADTVVEAARTEGYQERIDWWLEEGGDDAFVLDTTYELPEDMLSLVRLLLLSLEEWEKARGKGKMPKAKLDEKIYGVVKEVLTRRLAMYPVSLQEQDALLASSGEQLSQNRKNALIVTTGEQRILHKTLAKLEALREAQQPKANGESRKRKVEKEDGRGSGKKTKRV